MSVCEQVRACWAHHNAIPSVIAHHCPLRFIIPAIHLLQLNQAQVIHNVIRTSVNENNENLHTACPTSSLKTLKVLPELLPNTTLTSLTVMVSLPRSFNRASKRPAFCFHGFPPISNKTNNQALNFLFYPKAKGYVRISLSLKYL